MDLDQLFLSKALPGHYEDIVAFSEGIYVGRDYLPAVYQHWLEEEEKDPSLKRNFVLCDQSNNVLGFVSYLFQESGQKAICEAMRIDDRYKGKGVGRRFIKLCEHALCDICKSEVKEVKAVWCQSLPKDKWFSSKSGQILAAKMIHFYLLDIGRYAENDHFEPLLPITQASFLDMMFDSERTGSLLRKIIPGHYLTPMWEPISCKARRDVELMKPQGQNWDVLVDNTDHPRSFSLLIHPSRCPIGWNVGIDVYTSSEEHFRRHVLHQLKNLQQLARKKEIEEPIVLWVTAAVDFDAACTKLFESDEMKSFCSRDEPDFYRRDKDFGSIFLLFEKTVCADRVR